MFAQVQTLGAVSRDPNKGRLTLAGRETIVIRDQVCQQYFYHVLQHNEVTTASRPQPGDVLFVISQVIPQRGLSGSVQLVPLTAFNYGPGQTRLDGRGGHVLAHGVNQMWADGIVATVPRRQTLAAQAGETAPTSLFSTCLIVAEDAGLLETVAYGATADALGVVDRYDRVALQGRLLNEKRPDGKGAQRLYSRLDCYRQNSEERKPRPGGARPQIRDEEVTP